MSVSAAFCILLQSFDSIPDDGRELPVSRPQAYSSTSPPPLGPMFSSGSSSGAQAPAAGGLAAVQIPQGHDGSASSSPYYTPQQSQQGGAQCSQGQVGPLTASLQQQQVQQVAAAGGQYKTGGAAGGAASGQAGSRQQPGLRTAVRSPVSLQQVQVEMQQ